MIDAANTSIVRRRRRELIVGVIILAILAVLPLPIKDVYTRNLIIFCQWTINPSKMQNRGANLPDRVQSVLAHACYSQELGELLEVCKVVVGRIAK